MKKVLALIYLTGISKNVFRTGKFERCREHDNLMAYQGRPLTVDEFNAVAPDVLSTNTQSVYGMLPCVKLIEVEVKDPAPVVPPPNPKGKGNGKEPPASTGVTTPPTSTTTEEGGNEEGESADPDTTGQDTTTTTSVDTAAIVLPEGVTIEGVEGGFVVADMRAEAVFLGCHDESGWQEDVALVQPFATENEAKIAFLKSNGLAIPEISVVSETPIEETTTNTAAGTEGAASTGAETTSATTDATPPAAPAPAAVPDPTTAEKKAAEKAAKKAASEAAKAAKAAAKKKAE